MLRPSHRRDGGHDAARGHPGGRARPISGKLLFVDYVWLRADIANARAATRDPLAAEATTALRPDQDAVVSCRNASSSGLARPARAPRQLRHSRTWSCPTPGPREPLYLSRWRVDQCGFPPGVISRRATLNMTVWSHRPVQPVQYRRSRVEHWEFTGASRLARGVAAAARAWVSHAWGDGHDPHQSDRSVLPLLERPTGPTTGRPHDLRKAERTEIVALGCACLRLPAQRQALNDKLKWLGSQMLHGTVEPDMAGHHI